ncbi:hypothetical protein O3M35_009336 [Rhynocoris fuscipes]|uniref:Kazal-like domain-containing protein n=1 Tax=Rhynocoris fuscipes TaxID=488301 RepID=A0AAW1D8I4_9HEMI
MITFVTKPFVILKAKKPVTSAMKHLLFFIFILFGAVGVALGCACTRELKPVCARLGRKYRTFPNKCMLQAENKCHGGAYRFVRDGDCVRR